MAVTIGKSTLEDKIKELVAIDEKLATAKGDEKVLRSQAESALLSMSTDNDNVPILVFDDMDYTYAEVADKAEAYREVLDGLTSWMEQQVAEHVKATRDASKGDITALTEARAALSAQCEALATILAGAGIDDLPSIPKGKKGGSSTGGTRTVKVSGARYYREINGDRTDQPDSQNTLSSLVYYQSHHFSEDGKRMTTDDFVSLAKASGVDVKQATDWSFSNSNNDGSVTVGMEVIPTE